MSRRMAIWSAAALSLVFALLLGAVLLNPMTGTGSDAAPATVITLDSTRDVVADGNTVRDSTTAWSDDDHDEHDEHQTNGEHEHDDDDD